MSHTLGKVEEKTRQYQQYYLVQLDEYRALLRTLDLRDYDVVEIGVGDGALTRLVLERSPRRIVGYEIDPPTNTVSDPRLDFRRGDITQEDLSIFQHSGVALISNPPYVLLPFIRRIVDSYKLERVVLMVPERALSMFPEFEICFSVDGSAFMPSPPISTRHYVIKKWPSL